MNKSDIWLNFAFQKYDRLILPIENFNIIRCIRLECFKDILNNKIDLILSKFNNSKCLEFETLCKYIAGSLFSTYLRIYNTNLYFSKYFIEKHNHHNTCKNFINCDICNYIYEIEPSDCKYKKIKNTLYLRNREKLLKEIKKYQIKFLASKFKNLRK